VPQGDADVILAMPARVTPVTHARSTLIMASIESVRKRGQFAEYESALAPEHKEVLLHAFAGQWFPLEVALAHYAACDSLGLSADQHYHAGRSTFEGSRGTLLGTAVRMARGAGITPWNALPLLDRFWARGCNGGGVSCTRTGPKDAIVDVVQCGLFASPYFRNGLRGLFAALVELFSTRAYVTERRSTASSLTCRVQWA
jgi:hypothetical protein